MKSVVIEGKKRESLGKKSSKKVRLEENVPCVLYGGEAPVHFYTPFSQFRQIIYTPDVFIIELDIDGKKYSSILQDTQWNPIEEQLLHADFLLVSDKKPIKVELPIKIVGHAQGTKQGGKLKINMRKLKVKALAKNIPDAIDIDVEELGLGQSIKVGDLNIPEIEFMDKKSNVVVSVVVTRAARAAMG